MKDEYWMWFTVGSTLIGLWEVAALFILKLLWEVAKRESGDKSRWTEEEIEALFQEEIRLSSEDADFDPLKEGGERGGTRKEEEEEEEQQQQQQQQQGRRAAEDTCLDNAQSHPSIDLSDDDFIPINQPSHEGRDVRTKREEDILMGRVIRGEGRQELFTDREVRGVHDDNDDDD